MAQLPPELLERVKLSARINTDFKFFDQTFSVRSNTRELLNSFRDVFFRFLIPEGSGASKSIFYILGKENLSGRPLIIIEERNFFLEEECDLAGFAYMKIMDSVLSKIESHALFHGAALSFNGKGVIFPAASKSGKSTITLELVRRGFSFLSDDIAALSRGERLLHPFPKKIGLLPDTLRLFPHMDLKSPSRFPMLGGEPEKNKMLVDIEELFGGQVGPPSPLTNLLFLGPLPERRVAHKSPNLIFIVLNRVTDALMEEIREERGVLEVAIFPGRQKFPILKVRWTRPFTGLSRVETICYRNDCLIYDHSNGTESRPDFTAMPELKKISKSEALFQLLKEIKGGQNSAILREECGGSAARLMVILARMFKNVDTYYLTPGRLKERADIVCKLCGLS